MYFNQRERYIYIVVGVIQENPLFNLVSEELRTLQGYIFNDFNDINERSLKKYP